MDMYCILIHKINVFVCKVYEDSIVDVNICCRNHEVISYSADTLEMLRYTILTRSDSVMNRVSRYNLDEK